MTIHLRPVASTSVKKGKKRHSSVNLFWFQHVLAVDLESTSDSSINVTVEKKEEHLHVELFLAYPTKLNRYTHHARVTSCLRKKRTEVQSLFTMQSNQTPSPCRYVIHHRTSFILPLRLSALKKKYLYFYPSPSLVAQLLS